MRYSAQLRDRRWQRKRLEILRRDKWRCQNPACKKPDSDEVMLVVHHRVYHEEKKAWEYADDDLVTLCEHCHDKAHRRAAKPLENLVEGEFYGWHELSDYFGFIPTPYLTNAKGTIACGTFRKDLNPDAPTIVLPGTSKKHWAANAQLLCRQQKSIPVFTKDAGLPWEYHGFFKGERFTTDLAEIERHRQRASQRTEPIALVLFLEKDKAPGSADSAPEQSRLTRDGGREAEGRAARSPRPKPDSTTATPPGKCDDTIPYGFKRVSMANRFEQDDHPAYPSKLDGASWVQECLKPELHPGVPEEVKFLFETARGAMIYGLYFLPLAALAAEEGFRVLEAGVRHRCRQLGLGKKKSGKVDAFPDGPYRELVTALHQAREISDDDFKTWDTMVFLRNAHSHRTSATIRPRQEAIAQLAYIAELLNRLFK